MQGVTRVECLAGAKPGKQEPHPQGNLSSPGLSFLEVTCRPQVYFSSRPRKAAKASGQCQDELQRLKTPCPVTDHSEEIMTLRVTPGNLLNILPKPSSEVFPETSPEIPACKTEIKALRPKMQHACSPSGEQPAPFPFPSFSPTSFFTGVLSPTL